MGFKGVRVSARAERQLLNLGIPVAAMSIGWIFGAICAFTVMYLMPGQVSDLGRGFGILLFCFAVTPFHPTYWVYCALSVAWAVISSESEPRMGRVCDFLLFLSLVVLFALGFNVRILEPNFVADYRSWIAIVASSGIIVGLAIWVRGGLVRLVNPNLST